MRNSFFLLLHFSFFSFIDTKSMVTSCHINCKILHCATFRTKSSKNRRKNANFDFFYSCISVCFHLQIKNPWSNFGAAVIVILPVYFLSTVRFHQTALTGINVIRLGHSSSCQKIVNFRDYEY